MESCPAHSLHLDVSWFADLPQYEFLNPASDFPQTLIEFFPHQASIFLTSSASYKTSLVVLHSPTLSPSYVMSDIPTNDLKATEFVDTSVRHREEPKLPNESRRKNHSAGKNSKGAGPGPDAHGNIDNTKNDGNAHQIVDAKTGHSRRISLHPLLTPELDTILPYEVRPSGARGQGLFANHDIPRGTRILSETPLCTLVHTDLNGLYLFLKGMAPQIKNQLMQLRSPQNFSPREDWILEASVFSQYATGMLHSPCPSEGR